MDRIVPFGSGTTSACAENTHRDGEHGINPGNYLRVRGEYSWKRGAGSPPWELPPRARRIRRRCGSTSKRLGTTSACAENTFGAELRNLASGNYLRVRGEYHPGRHHPGLLQELPPRARRIQKESRIVVFKLGTTSACAENTGIICEHFHFLRNYLRVRGEYLLGVVIGFTYWELPPRARRIRESLAPLLAVAGTTSACAENTRVSRLHRHTGRNYLRVRGEYNLTALKIMQQGGTTSACAENTPAPVTFCENQWNYLRVRGEYPK